MTVHLLGSALAFPDPDQAAPNGLLAVGGDLAPERLLLAYRMGIFPWYSEGQPILWYSPDPRLVLLPADLHVPRRLARTQRRGLFELRLDTAFERVIRCCATVPRLRGDGTWITRAMIDAYCRLHELGWAHSAEAWQDDELVGGVYGVCLGGAFFGESMFTLRRDASKLALLALVAQLNRWGLDLLDCQIPSEHLLRFGARVWSRRRFLRSLAASLGQPTRRGPWRFDADLPEVAPRP